MNYNTNIRRARSIFGVIGGIVFIIAGITTIIPEQPIVGLLWTLLTGAVTLYYVVDLLRMRNDAKRDDSTGG